MSIETEEIPAESDREIPRPVMKKNRWPVWLVWLVPVAAAIGAGIYFHEYFQSRGPVIMVTFTDGTGMQTGDTKLVYRGVEIGAVERVRLSGDHQHVMVFIRLHRMDADLARSGALFWIVRPKVSMSGISGLSTILSGPYIELSPGGGEPATQFAGLDEPPKLPEPGLTIQIRASRIQQLQEGAPVFYRGVEIGSVRSLALGDEGDSVWLNVLIEPRYAVLVRTTSIFWLAKGLDVKGGIFSGVQMKVDSLRALVEGGITFSTSPKDLGQPAGSGAKFPLYEEPKDEWVSWAPKIALPPEPPAQPGQQMKPLAAEDEINTQQK